MKYKLIFALLLLIPSLVKAQDEGLVNLRIEARLDYMQEYRQGQSFNDNSGFREDTLI